MNLTHALTSALRYHTPLTIFFISRVEILGLCKSLKMVKHAMEVSFHLCKIKYGELNILQSLIKEKHQYSIGLNSSYNLI